MKAYTLVTVDHGGGERYEALYHDGRKIAAPDGGGAFTAASLLDALSNHTIAVMAHFIDIDPEWDMENDGEWPDELDEFPPEARRV